MPLPLLVIPAVKLGYEAVSLGATWIPRILLARAVYKSVDKFFSPGVATCAPFELDATHAVFNVPANRPFTVCTAEDFNPESELKKGIPVYGDDITIGTDAKRKLDKEGEYFLCDANRIIFAKPGQPYCEIYLNEEEAVSVEGIVEHKLSEGNQQTITRLFKAKQFKCAAFIQLDTRPTVTPEYITRGHTQIAVCESAKYSTSGNAITIPPEGLYVLHGNSILFLKKGEPTYEISRDQLETRFFGGGDKEVIKTEIESFKKGSANNFSEKARKILAKTFKKAVDKHQKEALKVFEQRLPSNYRENFKVLNRKLDAQKNRENGFVGVAKGAVEDAAALFSDKFLSSTPLDKFLRYKRDVEELRSKAKQVAEKANAKLNSKQFAIYVSGKNELENNLESGDWSKTGSETGIKGYIDALKEEQEKAEKLIEMSNEQKVRVTEVFKKEGDQTIAQVEIKSHIISKVQSMFPEISVFTKIRFIFFARKRLDAYDEFRGALEKEIPALVESTVETETDVRKNLSEYKNSLEKELAIANAKLLKIKETRKEIVEKEKTIVKDIGVIKDKLKAIDEGQDKLRKGVNALPDPAEVTKHIDIVSSKKTLTEDECKKKNELEKRVDNLASKKTALLEQVAALQVAALKDAEISTSLDKIKAKIPTLVTLAAQLEAIADKNEIQNNAFNAVNKALEASSSEEGYADKINAALAEAKKALGIVVSEVAGAAAGGADVAHGVQLVVQDNVLPETMDRGGKRLKEVDVDVAEVAKHRATVNAKQKEIVTIKNALDELRKDITDLQAKSIEYVQETFVDPAVESLNAHVEQYESALAEAETVKTVNSFFDPKELKHQSVTEEMLKGLKSKYGELDLKMPEGSESTTLAALMGIFETAFGVEKETMSKIQAEVTQSLGSIKGFQSQLQAQINELKELVVGTPGYNEKMEEINQCIADIEAVSSKIEASTKALKEASEKAEENKANALAIKERVEKMVSEAKALEEEARNALLAPGTVLGRVKEISEFASENWPKDLVLESRTIPSKGYAIKGMQQFSRDLKEVYGDPDALNSNSTDTEEKVQQKKEELQTIETSFARQCMEKHKEDLGTYLEAGSTLKHHSKTLAVLRDELKVVQAILKANPLCQAISYDLLLDKLELLFSKQEVPEDSSKESSLNWKMELKMELEEAIKLLKNENIKLNYDAIFQKYVLNQPQNRTVEWVLDELVMSEDLHAGKLKATVEAMDAIAAFERARDAAVAIQDPKTNNITEVKRFSEALALVRITLDEAKLKLNAAGIEYELELGEKIAVNIENAVVQAADAVASIFSNGQGTLSNEQAYALANPAQGLKNEKIEAINKTLEALTRDVVELRKFEEELSKVMAQPNTSQAMPEIEKMNVEAAKTLAQHKDAYSFIMAAIVMRKAYELLQVKEELMRLQAEARSPSVTPSQLSILREQIAEKQKQIASLADIKDKLLSLKKEAEDSGVNIQAGAQPGLLVEVNGKRLYDQNFLDLLVELEHYTEFKGLEAPKVMKETLVGRILDKALDEHARPKMRAELGTKVEKDLLINKLKMVDLLKSITDYNNDTVREAKSALKETLIGDGSKLKRVQKNLDAKLGSNAAIGLNPEYFMKLKAEICATTGYEEGKSPYADWIASLNEMIVSYDEKEKELFKAKIKGKRDVILKVLLLEGQYVLSDNISRTNTLIPEPLGVAFLDKLNNSFKDAVDKTTDEDSKKTPYATALANVGKMKAGCDQLISANKRKAEEEKRAAKNLAIEEARVKRILEAALKVFEDPKNTSGNSLYSFNVLPNKVAFDAAEPSSFGLHIFAAPMDNPKNVYTHCFRVFDNVNGSAVVGIDEKTYKRIVAANQKQNPKPLPESGPNSKNAEDMLKKAMLDEAKQENGTTHENFQFFRKPNPEEGNKGKTSMLLALRNWVSP